MLLNLVRSAITNALKSKLTRTYGPLLQQSFGHASLGILPTGYVMPHVLSTSLSRISFRRKKTGSSFVKHDPNEGYFFIDVPGCKATLEYEWDKQIVRIISTEVPKSCGGKGYGKLLAEEALTWIAKNNYRAKIECDFVENYVKKHTKYQKYIIK